MDTIEADISRLPMRSIIGLVAGTVSISKADRAKKDLVVQRVLREAPPQVLDTLQCAAEEHEQQKTERCTCKRKREQVAERPRKTPRTSNDKVHELTAADSTEDHRNFLVVPSKVEVNQIYESFYSTTGNEALASGTCGVFPMELVFVPNTRIRCTIL